MARPSHAEWSRTLVANCTQGTLGTLDRNSGAPYTSIVEIAPMPNGDALLFTSSLAEHTKNFTDSSAASLLVAADLGAPQPLARERVTAVGDVRACDAPRESLAERYLEIHPHAETYIDFEDFAFYRLVPDRLRYIGGFGRMSWVEAERYRDAEPDPVWPAADEIREHVNDDHAEALLAIARELGGAEEASSATLQTVDRYGFDLRTEAPGEEGSESLRIDFDRRLDSPGATREAFIELVERARSA